ncbi:anti-sigma factor [Candidatus Acetothermia bacterium]|nr:anti-sigma factor [Candidatus Acetothermia bacterium]
MNCREIDELGEAYALGALDPGEAARVESHLKECLACRKRIDEYLEIVTLLPYATQAVVPLNAPEPLKAKILQAIATRAESVKEHRRAWWKAPVWVPALAATSAIFLVALGLLFYHYQNTVTQLTQRVEEMEHGIGIALTCQEATHLPGAPERPAQYASSWGRICTQPDSEMAVILVADTPAAPSDSEYHVWFKTASAFTDAGVVYVSTGGKGWLVTHKPGAFDAVMVTLETKGVQSDRPSGTILIAKDYR